jgi:hypothetical protein
MDMLVHEHMAARVRQPRAAPVVTPAKHEGVGNALRSAYFPRAHDMPEDFQRLLDQLS